MKYTVIYMIYFSTKMELQGYQTWPNTLHDLCSVYIHQHIPEILADYNSDIGHYKLKEDIILPSSICDNLIEICMIHNVVMDDLFWSLFYDPNVTKLRKIKVTVLYLILHISYFCVCCKSTHRPCVCR